MIRCNARAHAADYLAPPNIPIAIVVPAGRDVFASELDTCTLHGRGRGRRIETRRGTCYV